MKSPPRPFLGAFVVGSTAPSTLVSLSQPDSHLESRNREVKPCGTHTPLFEEVVGWLVDMVLLYSRSMGESENDNHRWHWFFSGFVPLEVLVELRGIITSYG